MKPESLIILFLMFTVITISIGGIIGDMQNNYGTNVSTVWANEYNFQDRINESVSEVSAKIDQAGESQGYLTIVTGVSAIWSGIKSTATMILATPKYFLEVTRGMAASLGLPDIIASTIIPLFFMMIIVVVIFMAIRLVRGDSV